MKLQSLSMTLVIMAATRYFTSKLRSQLRSRRSRCQFRLNCLPDKKHNKQNGNIQERNDHKHV
uniref:Uncharacterized protein n=1 Tax=Arion vulgaris TaxID=1028688 RepID=A0A0B7A528_9EUPU